MTACETCLPAADLSIAGRAKTCLPAADLVPMRKGMSPRPPAIGTWCPGMPLLQACRPGKAAP